MWFYDERIMTKGGMMTYRAPNMTLNIAEQYLGVTCYYEVYINWDTYVVDTGLQIGEQILAD